MRHRGTLSPTLFVSGLLAVLVVGLVWALNPSERPGGEDAEPARETAPPEPVAAASASPAPSKTGSPAAPADADLLAAALPLERTTVQVLDAGGGADRLQAARTAIEALGYQVVATASSRTNVERTTVWFTSGKSNEAQALRVRDRRFADVAPNQGLSAGVDLHVLIGPDWG